MWIIRVLTFWLLGTSSLMAAVLSEPEMRSVLSGNSIISPDFGCVYYDPSGKSVSVIRSGEKFDGRWIIKDGLYYSNGQCGLTGCTLDGEWPSFTFNRTDGGYTQPVIVIKGNYCEKDGIVS
ncbi:MAG: hypothetical protein R3D29_09530 [Nitratireductor sp.]